MLRDIVLANRSYRRFVESEKISKETLRDLIDLSRYVPSAANLQPLKYMIFNEPSRCAAIFPTLAWAGYLTDWPGPTEGKRPSAYIVILGDTEIRKDFGCDHGIAAQTICLGAAERGIGACMIGSIDRKALSEALNIPERLVSLQKRLFSKMLVLTATSSIIEMLKTSTMFQRGSWTS